VTLQGRQIACPAQAQQRPVTDGAILKPLSITTCSHPSRRTGLVLYDSVYTAFTRGTVKPLEERIVMPSDPDLLPFVPIHGAPSSLEKRERLQRDARMQRILAASQRLFSMEAYDEIAIEDLAAAAGMSKGLLYHYFESKRDLYVATVAHVLKQMAHFTDLSPDLHAGLSQMLSLFEQSPGLAKMVLRGGIGVDPEVERLLDVYRQQQLQRLSESLGFLGAFADGSTDAVGSHALVLLGFVGDAAAVSTDASIGSQALVVLGLRGWLSLLDEVCLQWVQQPDVTREQVVRFLEQSLHAVVAATTSPLVVDDTRDP
jgi:AcrR family transcriptional regulator